MPRPLRTIRKPTRWTPDEWARVEDAARRRGVPPLRYVREAALGAPPAPKRYHRDELTRQLGRVLNNLRQLHAVAVDDWADAAAARILRTISVTEAAIRAAPAPGTTAAEAVQVIVVAEGATLDDAPELVEMRAAVALSGYTRGHLRRMLVAGTLTNYGTEARPLLRVVDLPRKPGRVRLPIMAEAQ